MARHLASSLILGFAASACAVGSDSVGSDTTNAISTEPGAPNGAPAPKAGASLDGGPFVPAAHEAVPQIESSGGAVIKNPMIVPITFEGDVLATDIDAFVGKFASSPLFGQMVGEYGVGAPKVAPSLHLADKAPGPIDALDDGAIQAWLGAQIDAGKLPAPTPDTLYVLFLPDGSKFTHGAMTGCSPLGGFHSEVKHGDQSAVYGVVGRCGAFMDLTGIDAVTAIASHEILEAVTDPYLSTAPAFLHVNDPSAAWEMTLQQGENGDMCGAFADSFVKPASIGYGIQRTWSNASARAGHDPCVPNIPGQVYFASAPRLEDVTIGGATSRGVKVPAGTSKTIDVDFFSDAPTDGPWTITVDVARPADKDAVAFEVSNPSGSNGHVARLTIRSLAAISGPVPMIPFLVTSTMGSRQSFWIGGVTN